MGEQSLPTTYDIQLYPLLLQTLLQHCRLQASQPQRQPWDVFQMIGKVLVGHCEQGNFADGFAELLPGAHYRRGIDVEVIDRQIYIDLYVVIQFGTRISEVANGIMSRVQYSVEKAVGLPVAQVNVHVQKLHMDEK